MLESGFIIAMGLVLIFMKLGWKARMTMLKYPLLLDATVFAFATALHWGTYVGVMSAAVAALMVSILITLARKVWGHMDGKNYVRGMFDISHKLKGL